MSDEENEEGEVEEVSAGEIPYEELPKPVNSLTEDIISEGLSEVKRTADGTSYAFTNLNLEGGLQGEKVDDLAVALRSFLHIRTVNFSKNALFMADEFMHLPYLQELNMSQNKIRDIRFLKENRESLCYLQSLNAD